MIELRSSRNKRPLLVGHRGAMAVAPENTMPSFEAGLAAGADILELDVQITADGNVVTFHDTDLFYKTGVTGRVSEHSTELLRSLDVGGYFDEQYRGTQMPLLEEVLNWAKDRITLMIELKHCADLFDPELDKATVELVEDFGMVDQVIMTSFDQFAIERVNKLNPQIATSFIYIGRFKNPLKLIDGLNVHALSPATDFLTPEEVKLIQNAGYACSPGGFWWDYAKLFEWGVDTISSNDPAAVRIPVS